MPELPEVETVVRTLRPSLEGETLTGHRVFDQKLSHLLDVSLQGAKISRVLRVGKFVVLALHDPRNKELFLAVHLRMSGRLFWVPGSGDGDTQENEAELTFERLSYLHTVKLKPKHLRIRFTTLGGQLLFFDPRRFGTLELHETLTHLESQGIDPMSEKFTANSLSGLLANSRQPIKPWLLRQDRILGIGNIYASEILFRAGISPLVLAGSLKPAQVRRLHACILSVLEAAIENAGTSISDFQSADGLRGGHQEFLTVYERMGEPCGQCGAGIKRLVQAGRSTYYCFSCQS